MERQYTVRLTIRDSKVVDATVTKGLYDLTEFLADGIDEPLGFSSFFQELEDYFRDETEEV